MNLNKFVLIIFLVVNFRFLSLNLYIFRGCVLFGVVKILDFFINIERRYVGEKNILVVFKLFFLNDYVFYNF